MIDPLTAFRLNPPTGPISLQLCFTASTPEQLVEMFGVNHTGENKATD